MEKLLYSFCDWIENSTGLSYDKDKDVYILSNLKGGIVLDSNIALEIAEKIRRNELEKALDKIK